MLLEAIGEPIKYRLKTGEEVTFRPGIPTELPDPAATQLLQKAPDKVRQVSAQPIQQGNTITWQAGNLTMRQGLVDFTYHDAESLLWAFVTLPDGGWAAVNTKYALQADQVTNIRGSA